MLDHVENKHDNNPIQAATLSRGNGIAIRVCEEYVSYFSVGF